MPKDMISKDDAGEEGLKRADTGNDDDDKDSKINLNITNIG